MPEPMEEQQPFIFSERDRGSSSRDVVARAAMCVKWLFQSTKTRGYAQLQICLDAPPSRFCLLPLTWSIGRHKAVRDFLKALSRGCQQASEMRAAPARLRVDVTLSSSPSSNLATAFAAVTDILLLPPAPFSIGSIACVRVSKGPFSKGPSAVVKFLPSPSCRVQCLNWSLEILSSLDVLRHSLSITSVLSRINIDSYVCNADFAKALGSGIRKSRTIKVLSIAVSGKCFPMFAKALCGREKADGEDEFGSRSNALEELIISTRIYGSVPL
ncbi:hypothetical protein DFJ73DRAFT_775298 [Zopfochytrium polystomum]|nr:hypothetical protein DFJ73DRAFT_775298 [Zopfochytrium polystomum]